jgi:dienelactone hydrolase
MVQEVQVPVSAEVRLDGALTLPRPCAGLVVFVHGSGSSRFSPRNRYVADQLVEAGLATLLFDLLTAGEEAIDRHTAALRFDIDLLTSRTIATLDWLEGQLALRDLPTGLFGASTGAAAALAAATARPDRVQALVSRGGRPDLAPDALPRVVCPTLLIVGARDPEVIALNRQAAARLHAPHELRIIPAASHLFEEPGTLQQAAIAARDWFLRHLRAQPSSRQASP